jgi:hypothetical protein
LRVGVHEIVERDDGVRLEHAPHELVDREGLRQVIAPRRTRRSFLAPLAPTAEPNSRRGQRDACVDRTTPFAPRAR